MPTTLGRTRVAGPPFTPLPYGLLSVADLPDSGDRRWQAGIEFQPDSCFAAVPTWDGCPTTGGAGSVITKSPSATGVPTRASEPFTVYAEIRCSPVGLLDEFEARTVSALTNGEARAVEQVFWTGVIDGTEVLNPHLAEDTAIVDTDGAVLQSAATVVTTGAPVDVVEAIGLLEGQLAACYGGIGVIHVPRQALAHLSAQFQVERDGQRLRTPGGNLVAAYTSNNFEGPTGSAPASGQAWFYATGAVAVRRSPIQVISTVNEAVDRSENSMVLIAERTYVIGWDCCHLAAQVSLGGVTTGAVQSAV